MTIDTFAWSLPEKSAAYLIPGERKVLVDSGSALTAPNVIRALEDLGIQQLDLIVLTHCHPDQAGGAGAIADRFPEARILVHESMADHLADPARLTAIMKTLGGDRAVDLFGEPAAVPPDRIDGVAPGEVLDLGDRQLEAIGTPGHTAAHLAWIDRENGALFCGDALGAQVPGSRVIRPSTPPSDFSCRQALDSIERLRDTGADHVFLAHFGPARPGLGQVCDLSAKTLKRWHCSFLDKRDETESVEELTRLFNASLEAGLEPVGPAVRRSLELISPTWMNLAGMKNEQARLQSHLPDAA